MKQLAYNVVRRRELYRSIISSVLLLSPIDLFFANMIGSSGESPYTRIVKQSIGQLLPQFLVSWMSHVTRLPLRASLYNL
jgi:hypothetical protein